MKSASIPSLRVEPELRQAAESVLLDAESLIRSTLRNVEEQAISRTSLLTCLYVYNASKISCRIPGQHHSLAQHFASETTFSRCSLLSGE